ncbi:MAG: hypothetical protein ACOC3Z_02170 [Nanoarchaeota archaeon]
MKTTKQIKEYLDELTKKEHFIIEIFYCLLGQGFEIPADLADLYTLIKRAISELEVGISLACLLRLPIEIRFKNIFSRMNITYNNYFVNPEVNEIW